MRTLVFSLTPLAAHQSDRELLECHSFHSAGDRPAARKITAPLPRVTGDLLPPLYKNNCGRQLITAHSRSTTARADARNVSAPRLSLPATAGDLERAHCSSPRGASAPHMMLGGVLLLYQLGLRMVWSGVDVEDGEQLGRRYVGQNRGRG